MKYCTIFLTIVMLLNLSMQSSLMAGQIQRHVVLEGELQSELAAHSAQRTMNIQEVQKLLQHDLVQQQVGGLVDLEELERGLVTLDDETLRELAAQCQQVNDQIEAGITTWGWIGIAILAAIAIIIIGLVTVGLE